MAGEVEAKANGQTEAIVPVPAAAVVVQGPTVEEQLALAERKIAFRKGIQKLIAANIEPSDIAIYGEGEKETIHLTKHACKQILGWAGISVHPGTGIIEKRYDGVEGPYIDFEIWATWEVNGKIHGPALGNRSTYDDFFAKRSKYACEYCGADIEWKEPAGGGKSVPFCKAKCKGDVRTRYAKTEYYLPLSEVDIPSVKQAAITNLWNHIVEDAGLKPSKKELEAVGFRFDQVQDRVKFGSNKPAEKKPQATSQTPQAQPQQQGAAAPSTPKTAAPAPSQEQKAPAKRKPAPKKPQELDTFAGYISEVKLKDWEKDGQTGRYARVVQRGQTLFCFHDGPCVTKDGDKNLLDLLNTMGGKYCKFLVRTKGEGSQTKFYIEGALQIGPYGWDGGLPILDRYMTEPTKEGYQATNKDVPF